MSTIKYIDSYSLKYCLQLEEVKIEPRSNIITIGKNAFSTTGIKRILIPKSIEMIGKSTFESCSKLEEVEIEEGSKLTELSDCLFLDCINLKSVKIPENSDIRTFNFFCIQ